jgi:integrase
MKSILTKDEVRKVLCQFSRSSSRRSLMNRTIFRLSCCCGLRAKEIGGLKLGDILEAPPAPKIRVRRAITKGRKTKKRGRDVPLWWDNGTYEDIKAYKEIRLRSGATQDDLLVCSRTGRQYGSDELAKKWKTVLHGVLSPERVRQLSIHSGRHTFISHSLNVGRSLQEVMRAAGHRNPEVTEVYMHVIDNRNIPDLFA